MARNTLLASAAVIAILAFGTARAGEMFNDKSRGYSVELPERWVSVSPNVMTQINDAVSMFVKQNVSYQACFVPTGHTSAELPRILIQFQPWSDGVPTYDVLEKTLKSELPGAVNKVKNEVGAPLRSLEVGEIALDRKANRLTMRMQSSAPGDGVVHGLSIGMLGRDGIVFLHCYARQDRFARTVPLFEVFADSFQFNPDRAYDPSLATITTMSGSSSGRRSSFSWMSSLRGGTVGGVIGAGIGLLAMASRYRRRKPV